MEYSLTSRRFDVYFRGYSWKQSRDHDARDEWRLLGKEIPVGIPMRQPKTYLEIPRDKAPTT